MISAVHIGHSECDAVCETVCQEVEGISQKKKEDERKENEHEP